MALTGLVRKTTSQPQQPVHLSLTSGRVLYCCSSQMMLFIVLSRLDYPRSVRLIRHRNLPIRIYHILRIPAGPALVVETTPRIRFGGYVTLRGAFFMGINNFRVGSRRKMMTRVRAWLMGLICVCFFPALAVAQDVPRWKVDPSWPKPLPNNWMLGHVEKVVVDKDGNIWVANYVASMDRRVDHVQMGLAQTPPIAECCIPAPEVIEFDPEGNVLKAWGGRGYIPEWPEAMHAFWVDKNMNVWVGGNHAPDRNLLKFTADGKLLLEIGHIDGPIGEYTSNRGEFATPNNQATDLLGGPGGIYVDEEANEVYVGGWLHKQAGRCVRLEHGKVQARLGRLWHSAESDRQQRSSLNASRPATCESRNLTPNAPAPKQFIRANGDG